MRLTNAAAVPIPDRLARRPRDKRGYPIPYAVMVDSNGVPDFRVTDIEKWVFAVQHKRCGLCGEPLGARMAFVGGPKCHKYRVFTDLPMHRDCAEYALRVCPYLALPRATHALHYQTGQQKGDYTLRVTESASTEKPDRFVLGIAKSYTPLRLPDSSYGLQAAPWQETVWWKDGEVMQPQPAD